MSTIGDKTLPVIAAGSLCAGPRQRKESVPRAFNLIEVSKTSARIHVRVKDERASSWRPDARYRSAGNFVPWYDVPLARGGRTGNRVALPSKHRLPTNVKCPTPFRESIASSMRREAVILSYVWNDYADAFDCNVSQIVLGPRGSGKTALLLSLTFNGRRAAERYRNDPCGLLARIGLMCPMKIPDASSFTNKGWLPTEERKEMFGAVVSTLWAKELVDTLELAFPWAQDCGFAVPPVEGLVHQLCNVWFNKKKCRTYEDIKEQLRRIRYAVRVALSERVEAKRRDKLKAVAAYPIYQGSLELLSAIADYLKAFEAFANTNWFVMFDEVENLTDWQQVFVYSYLAASAESVNVKIAALPYSHQKALEPILPPIVEDDDYKEIALALPARIGTKKEGNTSQFLRVAQGMWRARLENAGLEYVAMEDVWPEHEYVDVIRKATSDKIAGIEELEHRLINDLPPSGRARAERLRSKKHSEFSDQYWRKYQQPFRMRFAHSVTPQGINVPLYWGWRTFIRACDGNCRWFLMLADECWRLYWAREGLRPLSAEEEHKALLAWAKAIERKCGAFGEHGDQLREIVNQLTNTLRAQLYVRQTLTRETARIETYNLTAKQQDAIALGIAYGFLVPELDAANGDGIYYTYPKSDIEMRLGYPIAVAQSLLLRKGVAARIPDLSQVVFPWCKSE